MQKTSWSLAGCLLLLPAACSARDCNAIEDAKEKAAYVREKGWLQEDLLTNEAEVDHALYEHRPKSKTVPAELTPYWLRDTEGLALAERKRWNLDKVKAPAGARLTPENLSLSKVKHYYFPRGQIDVPALEPVWDALVAFETGGTGVLISARGDVVTAHHVVNHLLSDDGSFQKRSFRFRAQRISMARSAFVFPSNSDAAWRHIDLAILNVPELAGKSYLRTFPNAPQTGAIVFSAGFPTDWTGPTFEPQLAVGNLDCPPAPGKSPRSAAIVADAECQDGGSGGPLVDGNGRLLGILVLGEKADGFSRRCLYIGAKIVERILTKGAPSR